jgi:acyl carrier protein
MLANEDVAPVVLQEIRNLLLEDSDEAVSITGEQSFHELDINSLMLARLLIQLEAELGVDPFVQGNTALADIRSVNDLIAAYQDAGRLTQWRAHPEKGHRP